jgi:amidase
MTDLEFLPATTILNKIHKKEISVQEVISNLLKRIKPINQEINALVYYDEKDLLSQAEKADKKLSRSDKIKPLLGLPVTIKDNIEVKGMETTGGIKGRKGFIPSFDATVVQRLKDAGAIIVGKTNCPAYCAGYETTNDIYGRTNNPYDLERTVGSSSGGEAALIASGGSYLGIGSDTGGSIRWPSAFCGVASLVPTFGRVPRTGTIPYYLGLLDTTCIGPIARTVKDLVMILPQIMGPDNWDPRCLPLAYRNPDEITLNGLKVAYYADNGFVTADASVKKAIGNAADALTEKNIDTEEKYPSITESYLEVIKNLNAFANKINPEALKTLQTAQKNNEPFEYYPSAIYELADDWIDLIQKVKNDQAMLALEYYFWSIKWDTYRSELMQFMNQYDAIICPVAATPAFEHGESTKENFNGMNYLSYTHPYSMVGFPSVTVRGGETNDGLPIGFQILTAHGQEDLALKIALYLEKKLGGWQKPSL